MIDIDALLRGLAAQAATVEGVPAIVFNFSNFLNFSNSRSLIFSEVQLDSTAGNFASRDAIQFEHGAAGAYRHFI